MVILRRHSPSNPVRNRAIDVAEHDRACVRTRRIYALRFFDAIVSSLVISEDETLLPRFSDARRYHQYHYEDGFRNRRRSGDGLLREGAPGYELTCTDAKVDDGRYTTNAASPWKSMPFWYNALCSTRQMVPRTLLLRRR